MTNKKEKKLPDELAGRKSFSKHEFSNAMKTQFGMTEPQINYDLEKRLKNRSITRIGWGQYSTVANKRLYSHKYSDAAHDVARQIMQNYDDLSFQMFEIIQLNQFMNHQVAHNSIFVGVENELVDFVFDSLWKVYPGRVMLKPNVEQYYRYLQDDEIIVGRLPSESPKGFDEPWHSRLEKILVDVFTDKLVSKIIPDGEKQTIIDGAYSDFLIDEKTMIRYARRKGVDKKIKSVLANYGKVVSI